MPFTETIKGNNKWVQRGAGGKEKIAFLDKLYPLCLDYIHLLLLLLRIYAIIILGRDMKLSALIVAVALIVAISATIPPAIAAEHSAIGTFTVINAAPTVTEVVLYNGDESDTEFVLRITVADANTLNDLDSVVIELEEQDIATKKATFLWTAAEGWVGPEGRWSIKEAACKAPGELTETQFNYVPLMDHKSEKYVFRTKVIADGIVYAVSSVRIVESFTSDRI